MFDQSFAVKNLMRIYHSENKKGVNVVGRYFPDVLLDYEKARRVRCLIGKLYANKKIIEYLHLIAGYYYCTE
jgi:hypothetical protein